MSNWDFFGKNISGNSEVIGKIGYFQKLYAPGVLKNQAFPEKNR
jgi:hypothetical protein